MAHRRRPHIPLALPLVALLSLVSLSVALPSGIAQPGLTPPTDHTITSHDGTVLAATLYLAPAEPDDPRAAVLTTHGWASDRASRVADARWLNQLGYHVLAYDSRGFGESGGLVEMNGPNEVADVSTLIDWWVDDANTSASYALRMDGPLDPRLGMTGISYGGAIQLLAAAADHRIDAIVPDITWHDLEASLAPRDVVKRGWIDFLFWGGTLSAHGTLSANPDAAGGLDPQLRDWYLQAMATGRMPSEAHEPLALRSPRTVLHDIEADVLLLQGWSDTLFDPDQAVANHQALAARDGPTSRLVIHDGGHSSDISVVAHDAVRQSVATFLAIHLDDAPFDAGPPVRVIDPRTKGWIDSNLWQDDGMTRSHPVTSPDGATRVTLAQAPAPTSHTEQQALSPTVRPLASDAPLPTHILLDTGIQGPVTIAGRPTLTLNVTGEGADSTLFVSLAARNEHDDLYVLNDQVTAVRVVPSLGDPTLELGLVSLYQTIPIGHTLHVRLATTDSAYHASRDAGQVVVDLLAARLHLPVLAGVDVWPAEPDGGEQADRDESADVPAPAALMLVALLAVVALMLRRR